MERIIASMTLGDASVVLKGPLQIFLPPILIVVNYLGFGGTSIRQMENVFCFNLRRT